MARAPGIRLATGPLRLDRFEDPLLVDPEPSLLVEVVTALCEAAPDLVDPDVERLRSRANADEGVDGTTGVPDLSVVADEVALGSLRGGFHAESRVSGLVEAGALTLRRLPEPQPNVVLAGRAGGAVLVDAPEGRFRLGGGNGTGTTLRTSYDPLFADADPFRIRTPSRRRLYDAVASRCGPDVAVDLLRLLDADRPLDPDDDADPRVRAYLVGARHGVVDYDLRRACEDAGLASRSSFTAVKRRLTGAGIVGTERGETTVGRPRKRLCAGDPIVDVPLAATADVARDALAADPID